MQRVDKDMQRKREQEAGWEDLTDSAFLPLPLATPARLWRPVERHMLPNTQDARKPTALVTFDQSNNPFVQDIGSRYRKRIGRGGRVQLDRMVARRLQSAMPLPAGSRVTDRIEERWRYDSDIYSDLPCAREPLILDDYSAECCSARLSLVSVSDWESLLPNLSHLEEALRYAAKEPDPLPPVQVAGRLPGQRIAPFNPVPSGAITNMLPANMANQLYAAANRAMSVTQAQAQNVAAQQSRRASSGTPKSPVQQQPVSSTMTGQQPSQSQLPQLRRIMMENGA